MGITLSNALESIYYQFIKRKRSTKILIKKRPKITIKTRFLVFSDNFDHKYIKKNMVKGTPKPNIMYFGI